MRETLDISTSKCIIFQYIYNAHHSHRELFCSVALIYAVITLLYSTNQATNLSVKYDHPELEYMGRWVIKQHVIIILLQNLSLKVYLQKIILLL